MKVLHIYRTPPEENLDLPAKNLEGKEEILTFTLDQKTVDYDRLLELIFECDQVISWP